MTNITTDQAEILKDTYNKIINYLTTERNDAKSKYDRLINEEIENRIKKYAHVRSECPHPHSKYVGNPHVACENIIRGIYSRMLELTDTIDDLDARIDQVKNSWYNDIVPNIQK